MDIIKANLELVRLHKAIDNLSLENKTELLELLDLKSNLDMNEMISHFARFEDNIEDKIKQQEKFTNSKYNLLLGMISFLGFAITVITVVLTFFKE